MANKDPISFRLSSELLLRLKLASRKTGLSQANLVERCLANALDDLVARITGEGYVATATPAATSSLGPAPGLMPTSSPVPIRAPSPAATPAPGAVTSSLFSGGPRTMKPAEKPTPKWKLKFETEPHLIEGGVRENQAIVWPFENIAKAFGVTTEDILPMVDPEDDLGPIDGVPHGGLVVVTAANLAASLPRPDILAWARAVQPED